MPKAIRARTMNNTMMMIAMTSFSLTIVAVYLVDWEMRRVVGGMWWLDMRRVAWEYSESVKFQWE